MERESDLRSRVVAWLKIILPLSALAVLSTLFLFSREIDPEDAIPFADVDVEGLARDPRLSAPEYSGMTRDGTAVRVSAENAQVDPARASLIRAGKVRLMLTAPDGASTEITTDSAELDGQANRLTATGGVRIALSSGYVVDAPSVVAAMDRTDVETGEGIDATGPLGKIMAGGMTISVIGDTGQHLAVFNKGVRLIYTPHPQEE
ncbi:MAG: hypothetical protein ACRCSU_00255 [Paracoccaceae bacterium]